MNNKKSDEKTPYSVLMSVYWEEKPEYLKESIDSMLKQTLFPEQIVLVKDGSLTEGLELVISEFLSLYKELFTIVLLEENVGLGRALDKGLEFCRNNLVARMDTDDISLPDRCKKQVDFFEADSELSLLGSNIDEFYDEPTNIVSTRVVPTNQVDIAKFMRRRSPFNHPTVMFKKTAVIDSGGYGSFRRKQDLDLFSRMVNGGYKTGNINESLVLFRSNEANFKRRRSWSYCKSYIKVQYEILKRGHCSYFDFVYVVLGQTFIFLSPMWLMKRVSNKYLREL